MMYYRVITYDNMSLGVMLQEIVGWGADRRAADRLAWVRLPKLYTTLEATQEQIVSQSHTDATSGR